MSAPPPPLQRRHPSSIVRVVRAMYPYTAQRPDELSFDADDILYVLEKSSSSEDWWPCRLSSGQQGLVPANYVTGQGAEELAYVVHEAAKRGHLELLNSALENGLSANLLDKSGCTALHWAARGGHVACLERLLETGRVTLDAQNRLGDTALHGAAWGNHEECVKQLLQAGADPTINNQAGQTPRQLAKSPQVAALFQQLNDTDFDDGNESD